MRGPAERRQGRGELHPQLRLGVGLRVQRQGHRRHHRHRQLGHTHSCQQGIHSFHSGRSNTAGITVHTLNLNGDSAVLNFDEIVLKTFST